MRVVAIGDGRFSTELCGGTHVAATGDIGLLVLTEESGVAAGVRRVEALTGAGALAYLRDALDALHRAAAAANAPPAELAARIEAQAAALAKAQREIRELKTKLAMGGGAAADSDGDTSTVGDFTVVVRRVDGLDREAMRSLADAAKSKVANGVVFLAGDAGEGRVTMVAAVTPGGGQEGAGRRPGEAAGAAGRRRRRRPARFRRGRRQGRRRRSRNCSPRPGPSSNRC